MGYSPWGLKELGTTEHLHFTSHFLSFFFYFIFKLYNIVLVLPYIEMNLPQAYLF